MGGNPVKKGYVSGTVVESHTGTGSFSKIAIFPRQTSEDGQAPDKMFCLIGKEDEPDYKCYPYQFSKLRYFLLILLYLCTAGLLWLVFYWRPDWKLKFTHYPTSFDEVDSVFLELQDGTQRVFVSKIKYDDPSVKTWAPFLFARCSYQSSGVYSKDVMYKSFQNEYVEDKTQSFDKDAVLGDDRAMYFIHQLKKYMWDEQRQTFIKIEGYDGNVTFQYVHESSKKAVSKEEELETLKLYGGNVITVEVPPYFRLLIAEVLNPFYVFQMFACIFWMVDEYYAYATAIIIISFISAIVSLITIRQERQSLHDMVERQNNARITVVRDIKIEERSDGPSCSNGNTAHMTKEYVTEEIWIKDLVPGDIVTIPPSGLQLSFDAALISGTCIVNESMLTGESVPVTKTPLASGDSEMGKTYKVDEHKSHTLFSGTEVIQTRYYQDETVRAVIVRTGYSTAKGQLVHSILFPKPVDLKLLRDAYRFVGIMFCIAMLGFAYSTYTQITNGESVRDILFKSIDIITITVPPALPLAMTIGIIYAQARLKKVHIHTISPQRINICGQVDVVAFDKTGTLTEEGLDLTGIISVSSDKFSSAVTPQGLREIDKNSELLRCMATCHSLTLIDNEISGDPLDVKMLEATGWELVEPKIDDGNKYDQLQTTYVRPPVSASDNDISLSKEFDSQIGQGDANLVSSQSEYEVGIIRQFPFLSSLQRASVIAKPLRSKPNDMTVYVKGAPETIAKLCQSVPSDFRSVLKLYTKEGHRVIALAYKSMKMKWLKSQKIERELVEKDLIFLGLMILENKLKPSSAAVIRDLDNALIRNVMVTGDNLETAICVARDCKILKPNLPVLVPKCDLSSSFPILTWQRVEENDYRKSNKDMTRKSPISSSEESSIPDTIITMGDNISPYQCQLAVTGFEFSLIREYFPQFIPALAVQGAIFARMSPHHKTELMEELEAVNYHTLMCGDGANDCGALKRAHVGLSLSEYDASVAAPFTARTEKGIESVTTLIREGRAALVTSFGMFKFMALYSMIQFTTVLLLYTNSSNLSDYQFLYIDLIIIDVVALTMSRNHAFKILHQKKPPSSLVSMEMLMSLFLQIFLEFGLQILVYILVLDQCWYAKPAVLNETDYNEALAGVNLSTTSTSSNDPTTPDYSSCPALANVEHIEVPEDNYQRTYETSCLFFVSSFMYLSVSIAFSQGKPFRTAIYKNRFFSLSIIILAGFTAYLMFGSPPEVDEFFDLWHIPDLNFLLILCGIIISHCLLSLFIEMFLIENPHLWNTIKSKCRCGNKKHRKRYKHIENVLLGSVPDSSDLNEESLNQILAPSQFVGQPIYSKNPFLETAMSNLKHKTKL